LSEIRFYLDENMNPAIAEQLAKSDIDVVTIRDVEQLGDSDINHLQRATEMGRVLCTHDTDFLKIAAEHTDHAGII
jgi:predicted nuclease of predicted toxin-antitoxin system